MKNIFCNRQVLYSLTALGWDYSGQRRKWAVATGLDDHPKSVCTVQGADQVRLLTVLLKMQVQGWIQSSSSDLHKSLKFLPNLISQLFIAVNEINYPPCFIVYYEINKTTERLFRRSHSKPSPSQAKWTSHRSRGFVLC